MTQKLYLISNRPHVVQFADQTPKVFYVHWQEGKNRWTWIDNLCEGEHCIRCLNSERATKYIRWYLADGRVFDTRPELHALLWERRRKLGKRRFSEALWEITKIRDESQWTRVVYEVERAPKPRKKTLPEQSLECYAQDNQSKEESNAQG